MSKTAINIAALKRRAAWLALCAMALIIFAPLVSISLQQSPMNAMPGMHHEMSMPMTAHHSSAPETMPIDHGEACGYCVLLTHVPGLILALLYLKVRDYKTVALTPALNEATRSTGSTVSFVAKSLVKSRTMLWVCLGGAAQLVVVSAVWSWLPSFLNRFHGLPPEQAAVRAAMVVLLGAVGSVFWGNMVDRAGSRRPRFKLYVMAAICIATMGVLLPTFAATGSASLLKYLKLSSLSLKMIL